MDVLSLIKRDREARAPANKTQGKLYSLSDLSPKKWDYSLPTLSHLSVYADEGMSGARKLAKTTSTSFAEDFAKRYPAMRGLTQDDWKGVLVAGGCVGDIIDGVNRNCDVDVFLYGMTEDAAMAKVKMICAQVLRYMRDNARDSIRARNKNFNSPISDIVNDQTHPEAELGMSYVLSKNSFTINGSGSKIQIIFRIYASKFEILQGFDLSASSVGFDGTDVLMTEMAKFTYETGCFVADTDRASTSFRYRIEKYFNKNYEVILPYFDITKATTDVTANYRNTHERCIMPGLAFTYDGVTRNIIHMKNFLTPKHETAQEHDYDEFDCDEFALYHLNIRRLLIEDYGSMMFIGQTHEILLTNPTSTIDIVNIEEFYNKLFAKLPGKSFPAGAVTNYITVATPAEMFAMRKAPSDINNVRLNQIKLVSIRLDNLRKNYAIKWITDDPGTQISGSFNPTVVNPKDWYGEHFLGQ